MDAISISHQNKAIKKINALLIDQKSWGALNLILTNWSTEILTLYERVKQNQSLNMF